MRARTFERALQRYDRNLFLKRGPHPKLARQAMLLKREGRLLNVEPLQERFYTIWRWSPITGEIVPVLTIVDEKGRPRDPAEHDLRMLHAGDLSRWHREGEDPKKAAERFSRHLDDLERADEEKKERDRAEYIEKEASPAMKRAMELDGFAGPVSSPNHLPTIPQAPSNGSSDGVSDAR